MKKTLGLLGALLTVSVSAQSAPSDKPVSDAMEIFNEGHYLEAVDKLRANAFDKNGKKVDDYAAAMFEQIIPMVTNELELAPLDKVTDADNDDAKEVADWTRQINRSSSIDAVTEIARRARDTRIVILNEAHDSPRDRAFAWQVAKALRPLGYSILAAETFDNEPVSAGKPSATERLVREGFVRFSTGFYTRDPVYAGFMRNAVAAGYLPASYEQTSLQSPKSAAVDRKASINSREQAEAENLGALLGKHRDAKILVYVGYSHVTEAPIDESGGGKMEWMATRLKRMTGIDPLTIDQTTLTDLSSSYRPAYTLAAARVGSRPGVLFVGNKPLVLGQYAGAVDLQIIHPQRTYRDGRPAWLAELGGRPTPVPANLRPASGRRLVQVFAASAPSDAVPIDQIIVQAGKPMGMLMVPPGRVRFASQP